jgi:catechol 2,3-dioxygenase-like lactoylglutathione lyase family enzyme
MAITSIDHVTINVVSMEESIYFYETILGLIKLNSVDMGDHTLQYFRLNNHTMLELIQYHYDTGKEMLSIDTRGMYRHVALQVENIQEYYSQLCKTEVNITSPLGFCEKLGFYNILLLDPNGVEIELLERKNKSVI